MQHVAVALDLGLKTKNWVKYIEAVAGALTRLLLTPPFSVDQVVVLVPQRFGVLVNIRV
jgi:hypothetical protein